MHGCVFLSLNEFFYYLYQKQYNPQITSTIFIKSADLLSSIYVKVTQNAFPEGMGRERRKKKKKKDMLMKDFQGRKKTC